VRRGGSNGKERGEFVKKQENGLEKEDEEGRW